jgi:PEP-CTERM motif
MLDEPVGSSSFDEQLDAYTTAARAHAVCNVPSWWRRWTPYAAALTSGLALNTAADADFIVSNGSLNLSVNTANHSAVATPGGTFARSAQSFPMGAANLGLFVGFARTAGGSFGIARLSNLFNNASFLDNASGAVMRLAQGAQVSAAAGAAAWGQGGALNAASIIGGNQYMLGTWPQKSIGFAGVRIQTANWSANNQNYNYGWIQLAWTDPGGFPTGLEAFSWAYNTGSNGPILAGDAGSTPEPSSLALALMAAGSAGVLAWRRHRQSVSANAGSAQHAPAAE